MLKKPLGAPNRAGKSYPKATSLPQGHITTPRHDTVSPLEMALSHGNCFRILHQVSSAYKHKKKTEKMKLFVKLCQRVPSKGTHPSGLQETALSSTLSPSFSLSVFILLHPEQYHAISCSVIQSHDLLLMFSTLDTIMEHSASAPGSGSWRLL